MQCSPNADADLPNEITYPLPVDYSSHFILESSSTIISIYLVLLYNPTLKALTRSV